MRRHVGPSRRTTRLCSTLPKSSQDLMVFGYLNQVPFLTLFDQQNFISEPMDFSGFVMRPIVWQQKTVFKPWSAHPGTVWSPPSKVVSSWFVPKRPFRIIFRFLENKKIPESLSSGGWSSFITFSSITISEFQVKEIGIIV